MGTLYAAGPSGNGTGSKIRAFYNRSFALTFVSTLNESFTTIPLMIDPGNSENKLTNDIELALKNLPAKTVSNCNVNASFGIEERYTTSSYESVAFLNIEVAF